MFQRKLEMKKCLVILPLLLLLQSARIEPELVEGKWYQRVKNILAPAIQKEAVWALGQVPQTVTSSVSPRTAGGLHDFFSEGDYWWPDPRHVDSPYIQRDGMTNPENFVDHRKAMIRFSQVMGALASAYLLNSDERYAQHALRHANAWFKDPETLMNPHLRFAQAIKGRFTGRGIGIIDTIHLLEVARALEIFEKSRAAESEDFKVFRQWFADYLNWMTTHPYGLDESRALNNHGTCWTLQVSGFASFTRNDSLLNVCRNRYLQQHLPGQMAVDGSFPRELTRTKPYGYSLFNLDAMVMICQVLGDKKGMRLEAQGTRWQKAKGRRHEAKGKSDEGRGTGVEENGLWNATIAGGQSIKKGVDFLLPYVRDKKSWPYKQDVMYWDQWPVAHPFLLFSAIAYDNESMFQTWAALNHYPVNEEVIRNLPIRHPLIWIKKDR